ncbi:uncharacterized protein LOC103092175 isoform X8 [Monodelphis domestica]|uniref:uncharacterized protein LOC103092175 isoform X8 n=1 Tax=Monodelphis domestica TaxID=13616 RepID=UPI0024E1F9FF|nr:uncharacterized protein LOC103092175 isoform X8 [Monodelphis domestica]
MPLSRLHYTPHVERFISQNAWVMTSYNSWHIPLCHPEAFWESHLGTLCSWTAHSCGLGIFPGKGRWNAAAVRRRSPDSLLWLLRLSAPELLGGGKTPVHRFRVSELVPVGQERRGRSPGQPLRPQRKSPPPRGCHPLKNPRVAPQRARSQRNGPQDREAPLPGINNIHGCGCGLHPGRVVSTGPFSERAVPGGHAGECEESTLCGTSSSYRNFYLLFSATKSTMSGRAKSPKELLSRF